MFLRERALNDDCEENIRRSIDLKMKSIGSRMCMLFLWRWYKRGESKNIAIS